MTATQMNLKYKGELKCIRLQHLMMAEATVRNREALLKMNIDKYDLIPTAMLSIEKEHRLIAAEIGGLLNVV